MAYHCAVFGCKNGSYRLYKWKSSSCQTHTGVLHESCGCEPPFVLFPFPTELKDNERRQKWISMINREGNTKNSNFKPTTNSRVCSEHFKGGKPTPQGLPTEKLGYDSKKRESLLSPPSRAGSKRKASNENHQPSQSVPSSSTTPFSFPALSSTSANSATPKLITIHYPHGIHKTDSSTNVSTESTQSINLSSLSKPSKVVQSTPQKNDNVSLSTTPSNHQEHPTNTSTQSTQSIDVSSLPKPPTANDLPKNVSISSTTQSNNDASPSKFSDVSFTISPVPFSKQQCDKPVDIQQDIKPSNITEPTTPKIIKNINKTLKSKLILSDMKEKKSIVQMSKDIKQPLYMDLLKNDKKCIFYTNIPKLKMFHVLHDIIQPLVRNRFHRKIPTKSYSKLKCNTPKKCGRQRTLDSKDELLLTLMKLRLGLLFEDLGDRFGVSTGTASKIFQNWIRALSVSLESMIFLPSDEQKIWNSTPKRFRKFPRLNGIIDCTEVFIETPKSLELQRATWSEYKHHNTLKYLISVLPNSSISFVSEPYTGAISDKAIVNSTNFLSTLPPHSSLMTDKGFSNIAQECAESSIHLIVPPGKRGTSQMTPDEVKKTSDIAKTRILVEQVIRRIKTFQILANEVPISLLRNLNDIMIVCSAISNLREPIMK